MKVLFDNEIFLIQKYGGATRYFFELIRRLLDKDLEVSLYMGRFINQYGLHAYSDRFKEFFGKPRTHIPRTKLLSIKLQKPLFERFASKIDFDILHQTYFEDIKIDKKFKRIITIHDFTHEKLSNNFSSFDKTAANKKLAISKSDGIICVSGSTKNDLMNMYDVTGKKIKVIYHGNSLQYDVKNRPVVEPPYLLYVGDRRAYKNFSIMFELFERNHILKKDFKLVCCGGGAFTKDEVTQIIRRKLKDNFIQVEARDEKIANLYRYAAAFIYPSKYEGFGIPIIEAMYQTCPVIAANTSSLPEVGGDAALYFDPDNADQLNETVNKILNNESLRNLLKQKGKKREKEFSWDKCAEETFEFYKEVNG